MGDRTGIEWTNATWNPVRGCSRVSEGCRNCYAERQAGRFCGPGQPYEGLVRVRSKVSGLLYKNPRAAGSWTGPRWTGDVRLVPEHLADPLRWRKPRRIFVNSMSDLFHEGLADDDIVAVFGVMAACPQHTFQILTKRPARMREWFARFDVRARLRETTFGWRHVLADVAGPALVHSNWRVYGIVDQQAWPLPNVWLGVSVEDQATADERIPLLLETPAAVRFVSYEPALGPVDFHAIQIPGEREGLRFSALQHQHDDRFGTSPAQLDWIIAGSESGPSARAAELAWFRSVRDQCATAGVAFFFKQWRGDAVLTEPGSGLPGIMRPTGHRRGVVHLPVLDGRQHVEYPKAAPDV